MHDDRIFDLTDVIAFCEAFDPAELHWATTPEPWRHAARGARWRPAETPEEGWWYVQGALGSLKNLINPGLNDADDFTFACSDETSRTERKYLAFAEARTRRPKIGPLFSPLEVCWLCWIDAPKRLNDPLLRLIASYDTSGTGPVRNEDGREGTFGGQIGAVAARRLVVFPEEPFDENACDRDAVLLLKRFFDAETAVLRQAAIEAMAASEPPPQRARRRL